MPCRARRPLIKVPDHRNPHWTRTGILSKQGTSPGGSMLRKPSLILALSLLLVSPVQAAYNALYVFG
ncbi:hypothetical protein RZS08_13220, partial [Arthrospira platensis SPKY1]|nr:hypothetical protein [Arthrospira platensis SPKY1]